MGDCIHPITVQFDGRRFHHLRLLVSSHPVSYGFTITFRPKKGICTVLCDKQQPIRDPTGVVGDVNLDIEVLLTHAHATPV